MADLTNPSESTAKVKDDSAPPPSSTDKSKHESQTTSQAPGKVKDESSRPLSFTDKARSWFTTTQSTDKVKGEASKPATSPDKPNDESQTTTQPPEKVKDASSPPTSSLNQAKDQRKTSTTISPEKASGEFSSPIATASPDKPKDESSTPISPEKPKDHSSAATEATEAPKDPKDTTPKPLTIRQLKDHPQYQSHRKLSALPESTKEGQVQVGASRGKPFWMNYKLYGYGPIHIVWLCGHGDTMKAWRRHVLHFGHDNPDKYTSLLVDSRGVGESEGPFGWWSMKDMATDVVELLDRLEWTDDKSVHLVGHSMGGMASQEIALASPTRIASLTLISTTSDWMADLSVVAGTRTLFGMLLPKSNDQKLADVKAHFFGKSWINEPDEQGVFPTNGDNWAATSYVDAVVYYRGAALQGPACMRHHVKPEDLKSLAKTIGHKNIQIIHGHSDKIAPFAAAQRMFDIFGGHHNSGVHMHVFEDTGHMPTIERFQQTVDLIEQITGSVDKP